MVALSKQLALAALLLTPALAAPVVLRSSSIENRIEGLTKYTHNVEKRSVYVGTRLVPRGAPESASSGTQFDNEPIENLIDDLVAVAGLDRNALQRMSDRDLRSLYAASLNEDRTVPVNRPPRQVQQSGQSGRPATGDGPSNGPSGSRQRMYHVPLPPRHPFPGPLPPGFGTNNRNSQEGA